MVEMPDINVVQSDTYKEIDVTGQISHVNYDGMKMTVFHDSPDHKRTLRGGHFNASKMMINREIECTLNLSPLAMKIWLILLQKEVTKYEKAFGRILSPEEIAQKLKRTEN